MTYWEHITATAIGSLFAFLFGLALFYIKERWAHADQKKKSIKNLLYEFEYNLNLLEKYDKRLTEAIEAVSAEEHKIYLNLDYLYIGTYFARKFYEGGYIPDFLHQEDMRRWNIYLDKLSPGSETYVNEEVEKWRNNNCDKESVYRALKNERDNIRFAIEMIEYLKSRITF